MLYTFVDQEVAESLTESCLQLFSRSKNSAQSALFLNKLFLRHPHLGKDQVAHILSEAIDRLEWDKMIPTAHALWVLHTSAPEQLNQVDCLNLLLSLSQKSLDTYTKAQWIDSLSWDDIDQFDKFVEDFFSSSIDWGATSIVLYPQGDVLNRGVHSKQFFFGPLCLIEMLFIDYLMYLEQSQHYEKVWQVKKKLFSFLLDDLMECSTGTHLRYKNPNSLYSFYQKEASNHLLAEKQKFHKSLALAFLPAISDLRNLESWYSIQQQWYFQYLSQKKVHNSVLLDLVQIKPQKGWDRMIMNAVVWYKDQLNQVNNQGQSCAYFLNHWLKQPDIGFKEKQRIEQCLESLTREGLDMELIALRPDPLNIAANPWVVSLIEKGRIAKMLSERQDVSFMGKDLYSKDQKVSKDSQEEMLKSKNENSIPLSAHSLSANQYLPSQVKSMESAKWPPKESGSTRL